MVGGIWSAGHDPPPATDQFEQNSKDIGFDLSSNNEQDTYNDTYIIDGMKIYLYNLTGTNNVPFRHHEISYKFN